MSQIRRGRCTVEKCQLSAAHVLRTRITLGQGQPEIDWDFELCSGHYIAMTAIKPGDYSIGVE